MEQLNGPNTSYRIAVPKSIRTMALRKSNLRYQFDACLLTIVCTFGFQQTIAHIILSFYEMYQVYISGKDHADIIRWSCNCLHVRRRKMIKYTYSESLSFEKVRSRTLYPRRFNAKPYSRSQLQPILTPLLYHQNAIRCKSRNSSKVKNTTTPNTTKDTFYITSKK